MSPSHGHILFINIPFCAKRCHFCRYEIYDSVELLKDYINGLIDEMRLRTRVHRPKISVGYIGGGSPTLALPFLDDLITEMKDWLDLALEEFTIEAMPGTFGIPEADHLRRLGIDRISLGILSLNDQYLEELGRQYNSEQAVISYHILREVGFKNIDVVLALDDDRKLDLWQETIELVVALSPEHITLWQINPYSEFKECYLWADEYLTAKGYDHYEYSSFARSGFRSRFQIQRLLLNRQLGLGTGAETILGDIRETNYDRIEEYLDAINSEELPVKRRERIDIDQFRLISGLKSYLGVKKSLFPKSALKRYLDEGLFFEDGDMVFPTKIGYLLADAVYNQIKG
ncbi:hypothetical protein DRP53_04770 [candidate division WOR-3 bacterium]|uniref:Elp3/MiaA/NifB-like radical SAM core domain-containing protein n=1 Tax=candidate division WOR-3 bacterium TaxID=2052148 RepID=A0A660SI60_UNCW3|nr:MAG: hypothetical protein DRP53_04770 [candidate division WOR-3 bacterium]